MTLYPLLWRFRFYWQCNLIHLACLCLPVRLSAGQLRQMGRSFGNVLVHTLFFKTKRDLSKWILLYHLVLVADQNINLLIFNFMFMLCVFVFYIIAIDVVKLAGTHYQNSKKLWEQTNILFILWNNWNVLLIQKKKTHTQKSIGTNY